MEGLMSFFLKAFLTPSVQMGGMVAIFVCCLIFLISKRFVWGFIFLVLSLLAFFTWLSSPMGTEMIEKFQKKYSPKFHSADD
jgi:multisubunit Na+/H+ antiporter MnhG subunit